MQLDAARELAMKRKKRESLQLIRESALKARKAAHLQVGPRAITPEDLWLFKVNMEITRVNDEIFTLEKKLGITRERESAGEYTGAV